MKLAISILCLLAACAPAARGVRLADPPRPALPSDLAHAEQTLDARDGTKLYVQSWRPAAGDVRAVVVIHHGLADHSARYAGFAERLVRAGYAVWAHDMRGHGRSSGRRITVDRIDELVGDLDALVALVRANEPGKRVFLFGHSLGGLATALYAIEQQPEVAGVILSAPGIAFDTPAFGAAAIRFVAALAPNAPILDTPHGDFSSSPDVIADMRRDPLIEAPKGPARTARSAIDGVRRVWAHPERLVAPLLALHGTGDRIVAPIASRELIARAGNPDRTLRLYDDLAHDLLHEPAGAAERIAGDVIAWLDAHVDGKPAPFASSPARRLRGDRRALALALELDARGERSEAEDTGATAGLRVRIGIGRVGYSGGLDVRAGYLDGGFATADLHAAGLAIRSGGGASLALTGGAGVRRAGGATTTSAPIELALELPLGPVHVLARAGLAYQLTGDELADDALGIADEARGLVGIRLGRDQRYWPGTAAGAGPFLAITYQNIGGGELLGVALGGQLWGGH